MHDHGGSQATGSTVIGASAAIGLRATGTGLAWVGFTGRWLTGPTVQQASTSIGHGTATTRGAAGSGLAGLWAITGATVQQAPATVGLHAAAKLLALAHGVAGGQLITGSAEQGTTAPIIYRPAHPRHAGLVGIARGKQLLETWTTGHGAAAAVIDQPAHPRQAWHGVAIGCVVHPAVFAYDDAAAAIIGGTAHTWHTGHGGTAALICVAGFLAAIAESIGQAPGFVPGWCRVAAAAHFVDELTAGDGPPPPWGQRPGEVE